jgi:hypothetical protein
MLAARGAPGMMKALTLLCKIEAVLEAIGMDLGSSAVYSELLCWKAIQYFECNKHKCTYRPSNPMGFDEELVKMTHRFRVAEETIETSHNYDLWTRMLRSYSVVLLKQLDVSSENFDVLQSVTVDLVYRDRSQRLQGISYHDINETSHLQLYARLVYLCLRKEEQLDDLRMDFHSIRTELMGCLCSVLLKLCPDRPTCPFYTFLICIHGIRILSAVSTVQERDEERTMANSMMEMLSLAIEKFKLVPPLLWDLKILEDFDGAIDCVERTVCRSYVDSFNRDHRSIREEILDLSNQRQTVELAEDTTSTLEVLFQGFEIL